MVNFFGGKPQKSLAVHQEVAALSRAVRGVAGAGKLAKLKGFNQQQ